MWSCAAAVLLSLVSVSSACMRLQMDDRAVQWSTAIVEAKLVSIDPAVRLKGVVRTYLPQMGLVTSYYYYRVYHMEVTRTLDGTLKKGDPVTVVRLFWSYRHSSSSCQQNLTADNVGKQFLALLMPTSKFKYFVPEAVTPPKVKGGMFIVHLEMKEALQPGVEEQLQQRITSVRDAEKLIDPKQVDRLLAQVKDAPSPDRAGPALRALERMGPKIVPQLEAAVPKLPNDTRQAELTNVIQRLAPPPTTMGLVAPDLNIEDTMGKK
jgi:hypothetical protein